MNHRCSSEQSFPRKCLAVLALASVISRSEGARASIRRGDGDHKGRRWWEQTCSLRTTMEISPTGPPTRTASTSCFTGGVLELPWARVDYRDQEGECQPCPSCRNYRCSEEDHKRRGVQGRERKDDEMARFKEAAAAAEARVSQGPDPSQVREFSYQRLYLRDQDRRKGQRFSSAIEGLIFRPLALTRNAFCSAAGDCSGGPFLVRDGAYLDRLRQDWLLTLESIRRGVYGRAIRKVSTTAPGC